LQIKTDLSFNLKQNNYKHKSLPSIKVIKLAQKKFKDILKEDFEKYLSWGPSFNLELSYDGTALGYLAIDEDGKGVIAKDKKQASTLIAGRSASTDKMYLRVEGPEKNYLTHWSIGTDDLGASESGHAVTWKIKKYGNSSQLISTANGQSLGIKTANETKLNVRDDYLVLDVKITR
jgi:hypothetical protein